MYLSIEQLSPHCAPSRLPNITAPPMSGRLDGSAVVSEWIAECAVTKRHWGNPATGCGTPTQPGPSDGWSDTRRVYRPGFLLPPSSLSPPSSLNLLRPRASRAVPTGSLSGRDRRTCEKTVPCGEILRRRAPHVGSARGSIAFARGTGCNCWPNTARSPRCRLRGVDNGQADGAVFHRRRIGVDGCQPFRASRQPTAAAAPPVAAAAAAPPASNVGGLAAVFVAACGDGVV